MRFAILVFSLLAKLTTAGAEPVETDRAVHYDAKKNIYTHQNDDGSHSFYRFDALDRLVHIRHTNGQTTQFQYDAAGRLTQMRDPLGLSQYQYDIHDRLISVTDVNQHTLQYRYKKDGLLREITYPDQTKVSYSYNEKGQMTSVHLPSGPVAYQYDSKGRVVMQKRANGILTRYRYDQKNRLTLISHVDREGEVLLAFSYRFNKGKVAEMIRQVGKVKESTQYQYDEAARLVQVRLPQNRSVLYQYNKQGQRTAIMDSELGDTRFSYGGQRQLTEITNPLGTTRFKYDSRGNLLEKRPPDGGSLRYTWDQDNRLKTMYSDQKKVALFYDGTGQLVKKTINGKKIVHFINDPLGRFPDIIGEVSGSYKPHFYGATGILAYQDQGKSNFLLMDGYGTIAGHLNSSEKMTPYNYTPFGKPLNGIPPVHSIISGLPYDPDLKLLGRSHDPESGQSIQKPRNMLEISYGAIKHGQAYGSKFVSLLETAKKAGLAQNGPIRPYRQGFISPSTFGPMADFVKKHQIGSKLDMAGYVFDGIDIGFGVRESLKSEKAGQLYTANSQFWNPINKATLGVVGGLATKTIMSLGLATGGMALALNANLMLATTLVAYDYGLIVDTGEAKARVKDQQNDISRNRIRGLKNLRGRSRNEMRDFLKKTGLERWKRDSFIDQIYPNGLPGGSGGCGSFCDDGGGISVSEPTFGGVSLKQTAKVLAELNDVQGATLDPKTGQLILIGDQNKHFPPMNLNALVTMIRTIYSGEETSLSIEPCNPGLQDGCMKVVYNNIFQFEPKNEEEPLWVTHSANGGLVRAQAPQTYLTRTGFTLFESDRFLKMATIGRDNNKVADIPFESKVPGFESLLARRAKRVASNANHKIPSKQDCLILTEADKEKPSTCSRIWLVPDEIVLRTAPDGKSFQFDPIRIKAKARYVRFDEYGRMQDVPGRDPAVTAFVKHFTENYDAFEKQELKELVQLAKIAALVRWMQAHLDLDLSWVADYKVPIHKTPTFTDGVLSPLGEVAIYGGVSLSQNTYKKNDAKAQKLAETALRSRPNRKNLSWDFKQAKKTYKAVALNLGPTALRGAFTETRKDVTIPVSPDLALTLHPKYSSLDPDLHAFGKGWSLALPSLLIQQKPDLAHPGQYGMKAILFLRGKRHPLQLTTEGGFRPSKSSDPVSLIGITSGDAFAPRRVMGLHLRPQLPGEQIELFNASLQRVGYDGFAALLSNGYKYAFDTRGRLSGIQSPSGAEIRYQYRKGRLVEMSASNGKEILLSYNKAGRVIKLETSDGKVLHYNYDSLGHLLRVWDESNKTQRTYHHHQGRIQSVRNTSGEIVQEVAYDEIGRMTGFWEFTGKRLAFSYDDQQNAINTTGPRALNVTRRYDTQNRLVEKYDAAGGHIHLRYDTGDRIREISNQRGEIFFFFYWPDGNLREMKDPSGAQTRLLNYGPQGKPGMIIDPLNRISFLDYDQRGNITQVTEGFKLKQRSKAGGISYTPVDPRTTAYTYNDKNDMVGIKSVD